MCSYFHIFCTVSHQQNKKPTLVKISPTLVAEFIFSSSELTAAAELADVADINECHETSRVANLIVTYLVFTFAFGSHSSPLLAQPRYFETSCKNKCVN